MERHKKTVSKIAAAVRSFFDRKEPYRIFHGSTNSTRPFRRDRVVDISALGSVLEVNKARRTALVEPNVPMDRLVEGTLRHGLIPPVVMEFPGITAGGGYAGTAGESSSFKHGFFDDTINEVEMVLADGQVVRANRTNERADLFRGAAGAVGTLGVTTMIELQLVEAKKYVKTTYHRTHSVAEAVETVQAETLNAENDYVDGILFSKDHGVVITGKLTDEIPEDRKPQTFSGAWDPWFYLHVKDRTLTAGSANSEATTVATTSSSAVVDYVPLAEYLFRYDRAGFWVGAAAFDYFKYVPFTRFTRWFLDDFLHTRMLYRALHGSGESARFVVQDLALPYKNAERFVDYTAENFGIWPLWLCPLKQTAPPTFHPHTGEVETLPAAEGSTSSSGSTVTAPKPMLNIGLWGWGPSDPAEFVTKNRALEHKLRELGGMKWLYAHTYYTEDEFWQAYNNKSWYEALREKYNATTLPTVYNKVKVDVEARKGEKKGWRDVVKSKPPIGGLYGIYKAIQSKDYHLHRRAEWKWKGDK
ncbi:FAD binding domain-containing protein [Colletotrichum scovillei]|uniref:Delta(24)-sterol reductase n=1 Tax=Colletotrichum scovillei TaxID=1209932 RepID=A0A9P7U9F0_9PEZI|nr:FAD binding domain-containing protein [Colletotrichum scovillei]KAF4780966.1 FAD binding domain-containing protein [Colletotrichum scovillei]KAG7045445.1 delta24-sterol reductase [Colletotrichum scovillei]KAG7052609.1 delta24-sterol reductase [Colletotrichum scovillei]KAG7064898.1 delta24-sterol reductase [Colletotrichum scovillei]